MIKQVRKFLPTSIHPKHLHHIMNKALQAELERVRQVYQPDEEAFQQRLALNTQHVQEFTEILRPLVHEALTAESKLEVALEWKEQASLLAARMLSGNTGTDAQREQAERELTQELAAQLAHGDPQPTVAEIEAHAIELAQLLLSNWTALLEHALEDSPRLELVSALPSTSPAESLVAGVEAFVLDVLSAGLALSTYQQALADREEVVALTPTVHIFSVANQWRATRTRRDADAWLAEMQRACDEEAQAAFKRAAEKVMNKITPLANARVHNTTPHAAASQVARLPIGREMDLASGIAVCVLAGDWGESFMPGKSYHDLYSGMIKVIQSDLRAAFLTHRPVQRLHAMVDAGLPCESHFATFGESTFYRVSLIASGLVFEVRRKKLPVQRLFGWGRARMANPIYDHNVVTMMAGTVNEVVSDAEGENLTGLFSGHGVANTGFGELYSH